MERPFSYGRLLAFIVALNLIVLIWRGVITERIDLPIAATMFVVMGLLGVLAYFSGDQKGGAQ